MTQTSNGNGVRAKRGAKAINESLNKRLAVYALAAGAAGVGVLALAPAAQATIILDTTSISIDVNTTEFLTINGKNVLSFPDVNVVSANAKHFQGHLSIGGLNGAGVEIGNNVPLAKGASVGPGGGFFSPVQVAANLYSHVYSTHLSRSAGGIFANKAGYFGFKFGSPGKSYFGWAHLQVTANSKTGETGVISSFAWENVAGQSIQTGEKPPTAAEPGALTLSLLALGALGLVELRRRSRSSISHQESASNF